MKQALFVLEWRRLKASFVLSLALGLAVIIAVAFFLMSRVRQHQTYQTLNVQIETKQAALSRIDGNWRYIAIHPDETSPDQVAQAKLKVRHARHLARLYTQQKQFLSRHDNRNYLKTSLAVFHQEALLKKLSPYDFSADLIFNWQHAILFRKLIATHQGYEINGSATLPAVFLTDFSHLIKHWAVLLLMVMILSTTWTLSWVGNQHKWITLNQPNHRNWLAMNFLVILVTWLLMLFIMLGLGLLISKLWGRPLISGTHSWQNTATDHAQPLKNLLQENIMMSIVRFAILYFTWQFLSMLAARVRR